MEKIYFGNENWIHGACFKLRYDIFVLEQGISPQEEFDALDTPDRRSFLLMEGQTPLGMIRYQEFDPETVQPDRICVAKESRGQGIGQRLLAACEKQAQKDGYRRSYLVAEVEAAGFYERSGYRVVSEPYLEVGILCVTMIKDLS